MSVRSDGPGVSDDRNPPMTFLHQAIKAVPQVRWALGVLGVAAAASLVFGLFANKFVATAGTFAMLVLMVVLVVFARGVATLARTSLRIPALFFMWAAMILTVGPVALAITSLFFNQPMTRQELLSLRVPWFQPSDSQEPITELSLSGEANPVSLDRLRPGMLQAIPTGANDREVIQSLAQKGSLRLENSCLVLGDITPEPRTVALSIHTLSLIGKSCIITNGNYLDLTVVDLIASGGTIRSFDGPSLTPPAAPPGAHGVNGHGGGGVSIRVLGKVLGPLAIDLRGQNGGNGGQGLPGAAGLRGNRGADAVTGPFDCHHGGEDGGRGGQGAQGGAGAPGGDGGDGGNLTLRGRATQFADQIVENLTGGDKGLGGSGGPGGAGGVGGEGGSGNGFCGGGHGGVPGPNGAEGPPGVVGEKAGAEGKPLMRPDGA